MGVQDSKWVSRIFFIFGGIGIVPVDFGHYSLIIVGFAMNRAGMRGSFHL
jgi:hypothetical protein